ncbi:FxSxx-COOH system tetratricopeptide repeat protein [Streptomyces sp. URMC 129]|uniref:FxSxx-COOH system tetratricopeptide repeat protein n=1 Tax=Streptomyces sp. URMC 129 TaxID=3423407 RepID=UPI003F194AA9
MGGEPGRVFISYAGVERAWAEWVGRQLEDAGYLVELDAWDWAAGENTVLRMSDALERGRMLALFSGAYFERERFTTDEWTTIVAIRGKLIPVRLDDAPAPAILRSLHAPSLAGLERHEARRVLLEAVAGPRRPDGEPTFPPATGNGQRHGRPGPRLPGSLPPVWNVPRRNTAFTGRDGMLIQVRTALTDRSRVAVTALRGRGGVGKTQLAIEYAHRFAGEYDFAWWVASEAPGLIPGQLAALAAEIGAADADAPVEKALAALGRELRARDRWLLIFDNAEDPAALVPYLPDTTGHVVITSRNPYWTGVARALEVDTLARTESVRLLRDRAPALPHAEADHIAAMVDDLPLALEQAAALLAEGMTPQEYLTLLDERVDEVLNEGSPHGYPAPLAAQIRLSTQRLAQTNPAALALLRGVALLAPEPFPLHACADEVTENPHPALAGLLGNPLQTRTLLSALARQGLARVQDGTLQPHRLTQALIRHQLTDDERADAARAAETLIVAAYPGDPINPATWPRWQAILPHLLAADPAHLTTEAGRDTARSACWYLMERAQPGAALPRLEQLHETWTAQLGPDHEGSLWTAIYLARAHSYTGDLTRARQLGEDTLERRRRVLGEDHPDTLNAANTLANRLAELGETQDARELAEDTLTRQRRVLGEDHPDTLITAHNFAIRLGELGETQAARELGESTLAQRRRVLGHDHPHTLSTAYNLAMDLGELGELQAARALGEDTLAHQRRVLGHDHPHTLNTAHNLAMDLRKLGELQAARALAEDTLAHQRRVLGHDHPHTLNALRFLGSLGDGDEGTAGHPGDSGRGT